MMKKQLLLLAMILLPIVASADAVEINGIWYDLDSSAKTAEVTNNPDNQSKYTGNVVIPESVIYKNVSYSVTSISKTAFFQSRSLTSVTIPNSVTSIGENTFQGCLGLTSVTIPNSVTNIGNDAFGGCSSLTSLTIPNSVTSIGKEAFRYCSGLTSFTIPNSVTSIEMYTFLFCTGLTSVTIPNSVTSIGGAVFYGCSGLTSVTIPNSVTTIGNEVFEECSGLTSVTIGSGVKTIGYETFASCSKLTDVYCLATDVPDTKANAFDASNIASATLHVPATSVDAYKAAEPWKNFKEIVGFIKGNVNGDSDVDIADAVCIVNHVVGKPNTTFNEAAADANGDDDIDIADAVHIVNYVVGKIQGLAPRFEMNMKEPE